MSEKTEVYEFSDHNSDSESDCECEIESTIEDIETIDTKNNSEKNFFYISKSGFKWNKAFRKRKTGKHNIMRTDKFGPTNDVKNCKTPLECFRLFFSDLILETVVRHTNQEILRKKLNYKTIQYYYYNEETDKLDVIFSELQ